MKALWRKYRGGRGQGNPGRPGMSLIEVIISLTITSILLVAVAVAYKASADAMNTNDAFFKASQAARIAMNQMLTEIRRADAVQVTGTTSVDIIRPAPNRLANEVHRVFTYDAVNKIITAQVFYSGVIPPSPVYTLASNVQAGTGFGPAEMGTDYDGSTVAVRVPISIVVSTGKGTVALSGAAAPRRASKY
jgi:prepilin-type N-terminal cleavage/methylation domain-containing protein